MKYLTCSECRKELKDGECYHHECDKEKSEMKPSEIINEIHMKLYDEQCDNDPEYNGGKDYLEIKMEAILMYLDEQYNQQNNV